MTLNELALLNGLAEAEEDVAQGRVVPMEDVFEQARAMLDEMLERGEIH